jgi:hypothetical protein
MFQYTETTDGQTCAYIEFLITQNVFNTLLPYERPILYFKDWQTCSGIPARSILCKELPPIGSARYFEQLTRAATVGEISNYVRLEVFTVVTMVCLQTQRFRVRFPALPDFLSSSESGTGSTQPREDNRGANLEKKYRCRSRKLSLKNARIRRADHATPIYTHESELHRLRRSLSRYTLLANQNPRSLCLLKDILPISLI